MARFLFTTFGSLGDLHPYIAVARGLRERGHAVTIGTSGNYRRKVEGEGLGFHALGPEIEAIQRDPEVMRQAMHPRTGTEYLFRKVILPHMEELYECTLAAARTADLLVGHGIAFATPIVAEVLKKPWISIALQPSVFLSAYDPMEIPGVPWLSVFRGAGPWFWRAFFALVRAVIRQWSKPVNPLRARHGLAPVRDPLLDGMFSPYGTQAWFSKAFAQPQPDWPAKTSITGFPFFDSDGTESEAMPSELARFLDAGAAPVVFTLGSTAVYVAGDFYEESVGAVRGLGARAVLLTGRETGNLPANTPGENICIAPYASYSELFPRCAAIVHQGGVGTTAQALRAGRPMIVVPFSHDQPDNAVRIARLGAGRVIPRTKYRAERARCELKGLLGDASYANAAAEAAATIRTEDGVRAACDGLEAALNS